MVAGDLAGGGSSSKWMFDYHLTTWCGPTLRDGAASGCLDQEVFAR
jgi:hypothetical protein